MSEQKETKKLRSLSMKNLGFSAKELRKLVDGKKEAVFLARIAGIAVETFVAESQHGESVGFKGEFVAITCNGDQFTSNTAFLPANVATKLAKQFEQGVVEVEIKADVYVSESEKSASGYGYICEPVMSAEQQSRLQKLATETFGAKLPKALALAAPKAEDKKVKAA